MAAEVNHKSTGERSDSSQQVISNKVRKNNLLAPWFFFNHFLGFVRLAGREYVSQERMGGELRGFGRGFGKSHVSIHLAAIWPLGIVRDTLRANRHGEAETSISADAPISCSVGATSRT